MKNNYLVLALSIVSLLLFTGCDEDDASNGQTPDNADTIFDYIAGNEAFSTLNEAITTVGLDTALDGTDDYTLFAPDNEAFEAFLTSLEYENLSEVPSETLRQVVFNHLVIGNVSAAQLPGYVNSFAEAEGYKLTLYAANSGAVLVNGNATVVNADVNRSNGVVHEVSSVIDLLAVDDMVRASSDFSLFDELLTLASVDSAIDYHELLAEEEAINTVFVPSNEAFEELFAFMGVSGLEDISTGLLQNIVRHHIVPSSNFQGADLEPDLALTTRAGEELLVTIDTSVSIWDASGIPTGILRSDVQTVNGVIHEVDRVLQTQFVLKNIDPTITRWITVDPSFSTLETALEVTGLDEVLDDRDSEFTLLAPDNAAFASFLQGEDVDDIPLDILTNLLLNHVIAGEIMSGDLTNGYVNTEAVFDTSENKLSMYIDTTNGVLFNGSSSVSQADVAAANGVIHVVDAVIPEPTVVTLVTANPDFASLTAALTREDQPDYVATLSTEIGSGDTPFTVWAPDNNAFESLLLELGLGDLSEIDGTTLTNTLNTHVVPMANLRAEDLESGPLATLGDEIAVDAANATLTDGNDRTSTILQVNIQAANGVLHLIDTVLLPE